MNSITQFSLTYDDIQLRPSYSEVLSRSNINLETKLSRRYIIKIPLVASPMDTICDSEMAIAMMELGGVGCIHRFMTITDQVYHVNNTIRWGYHDTGSHPPAIWNYTGEHRVGSPIPVMAAIGANGDYLERAKELVVNGANVLLIDVAHGHHIHVKTALKTLKENLPAHVDIIAGNIATAEAAKALMEWGADGLRVGVGGGSLCTTRIKTGFGIPTVTSLMDVSHMRNAYIALSEYTIPIMADGGIRCSGDIAKALAVGSDCIMLGSLLAGTKESPGKIIEGPSGLYKRYRGAASLETKSAHNQSERNVEGESTVVPFKGGTKFVVEGLLDGVRSALSYAGADSIYNFKPTYCVVTAAGVHEAKPHLL